LQAKRAVVYKKGVAAATLTSAAGNVSFAYLPEYLAGSASAVATTLPKSEQPIRLAAGATPPFFSGLLPEGQRLLAMKNRLKTSLSDELGLLIEIGADLIGDVQVLAEGVSPSLEREVYSIPTDPGELAFAKLREQVFGARSTGLPGVQDKVSSRMLNAPVRYAGYDYILKLNPLEVPHAVENEHFFLGLARSCDLRTADFRLLTDSQGEHALRLRRFDRVQRAGGQAGGQGAVGSTGTLRLAQEDGAQVLGVYPSAKYDVDFIEMASAMQSNCAAPAAAGLELFKQLVFNWLIGNGDAHAKNYSIIEGAAGEWVVAPAYDLLCTRFYDDRTMALAIQGKSQGWSRALLVDAALALGVAARLANKVIDRQLLALAELPQQIEAGALPFARHLNREVAGFLRRRSKSLATV